METVIYLDTHVAAWLYAGLTDRFGGEVRAGLEQETLLVSPMVELELQYLYEIGRIGEPGRPVIEGLEARIGPHLCDRPFPLVVSRALDQTWTSDPFDRLIVSQAALSEAPLVTKDRAIRGHYPRALWADP